MEADPALNRNVYKGQIGYVYQHVPSNLIANLLNSAILVYIQWPVIPHPVLILWFVCIVLLSFLRMISAYLFKKQNHLFVPKQWGCIYVSFLFLSGIAWRAAGIYLFPEKEMSHQIIVAFVVGGMIAGASATASAMKGAFFFYLIPALTPLIYQYAISPEPMGISMSVMLILYAFVSITLSRNIYRVTLGSIVFQTSNIEEAEARKEAEKKLEKEQNFLMAVLSNIADGIVACDEKGVLTLFNRAAREFHGLEEQPLEADKWAPFYDLYLADGRTLMRREDVPLYQAFQGEHVQKKEMVIIPKDGKKRTVMASGQLLRNKNGEKIGAVVSMNDVTEQKEAQAALRAALDDLELKVQERTEELILVNRDLRNEIDERRKVEQEKEKLIVQLQEAIERIKTLSGIVPICMYCKQIRDDKGYWNNLEKFISEHSEAQFSHSICPKCIAERYPDYVDQE
jgi:PAS domain S-box-containing protein